MGSRSAGCDNLRSTSRTHTFLILTGFLLGPDFALAFFSSQSINEPTPRSLVFDALLFVHPVILSSSNCPPLYPHKPM